MHKSYANPVQNLANLNKSKQFPCKSWQILANPMLQKVSRLVSTVLCMSLVLYEKCSFGFCAHLGGMGVVLSNILLLSRPGTKETSTSSRTVSCRKPSFMLRLHYNSLRPWYVRLFSGTACVINFTNCGLRSVHGIYETKRYA